MNVKLALKLDTWIIRALIIENNYPSYVYWYEQKNIWVSESEIEKSDYDVSLTLSTAQEIFNRVKKESRKYILENSICIDLYNLEV